MMGSLVKLVFLSSAIHMLAFATFSTLPFAVGQVQDVGLIFLSSIATSVVALCGEAGWPQDGTLATALATLTLSTGVAGLLIICTGVTAVCQQFLHAGTLHGLLAIGKRSWVCCTPQAL
jgi:SulP family sulfate permease